MWAAALRQFHPAKSQCETRIEKALRIFITHNSVGNQGSQTKLAESPQPCFSPGLCFIGGTGKQADGHRVLKVSQGTAETPRALQPEPVSLVTRPRSVLCQLVHGKRSSAAGGRSSSCPGSGGDTRHSLTGGEPHGGAAPNSGRHRIKTLLFSPCYKKRLFKRLMKTPCPPVPG